jgi:hypothetical protein
MTRVKNEKGYTMTTTTNVNNNTNNAMSERNRLELEINMLKQALADAKAAKGKNLSMKISAEKKALSLYGMGRFPVTLYKSQWLKLLDFSGDIRTFIEQHDGLLADKE